jgi:hypothetical protein
LTCWDEKEIETTIGSFSGIEMVIGGYDENIYPCEYFRRFILKFTERIFLETFNIYFMMKIEV